MAGEKHQQLLTDLESLIRPLVAGTGLELVELSLTGPTRNRLLRIFIDRAGAQGVGIEDCTHVSRILGEPLEDSGMLAGRYVLEVSSPGVDRPIRSEDDIRRNIGRSILVKTRDEVEGRSRFRGRLLGGENGALVLQSGDDHIRIPLDSIERAQQDVGL